MHNRGTLNSGAQHDPPGRGVLVESSKESFNRRWRTPSRDGRSEFDARITRCGLSHYTRISTQPSSSDGFPRKIASKERVVRSAIPSLGAGVLRSHRPGSRPTVTVCGAESPALVPVSPARSEASGRITISANGLPERSAPKPTRAYSGAADLSREGKFKSDSPVTSRRNLRGLRP